MSRWKRRSDRAGGRARSPGRPTAGRLEHRQRLGLGYLSPVDCKNMTLIPAATSLALHGASPSTINKKAA